jgi:FkbM family methyltransferase
MLETFPGVTGGAYEPVPSIYNVLVDNVLRNNLGGACECYRVAVRGDEGTELGRLCYRSDFPEASTVISAIVAKQSHMGRGEWINAPFVSLRTLLSARRVPVDLVKIDVEGAEYDIVLGTGVDALASIGLLVLEYHDVPGRSWNELVEHLRNTGLQLWKHEPPLLWFGSWS